MYSKRHFDLRLRSVIPTTRHFLFLTRAAVAKVRGTSADHLLPAVAKEAAGSTGIEGEPV